MQIGSCTLVQLTRRARAHTWPTGRRGVVPPSHTWHSEKPKPIDTEVTPDSATWPRRDPPLSTWLALYGSSVTHQFSTLTYCLVSPQGFHYTIISFLSPTVWYVRKAAHGRHELLSHAEYMMTTTIHVYISKAEKSLSFDEKGHVPKVAGPRS